LVLAGLSVGWIVSNALMIHLARRTAEGIDQDGFAQKAKIPLTAVSGKVQILSTREGFGLLRNPTNGSWWMVQILSIWCN
jgi:hypothetical protein